MEKEKELNANEIQNQNAALNNADIVNAYKMGYRDGYIKATETITSDVIKNISRINELVSKKFNGQKGK